MKLIQAFHEAVSRSRAGVVDSPVEVDTTSTRPSVGGGEAAENQLGHSDAGSSEPAGAHGSAAPHSSSPEGVPPDQSVRVVYPPPTDDRKGRDSRHSPGDPVTTVDLYERMETVGPSARDIHAMFETSKVRSACRGFSLYSAEDELGYLEQGRYLPADPNPLRDGTSWLYRGATQPEVRNGFGVGP